MPTGTDFVRYTENDVACPTCAGTIDVGYQNYVYDAFLTWSGAGDQCYCPTCSGYYDITTWTGTLSVI